MGVYSFVKINLSCFHQAAEVCVIAQAPLNQASASSIRRGLCSPFGNKVLKQHEYGFKNYVLPSKTKSMGKKISDYN